MTGLEKILQAIKAEADNNVKRILSEADKEAEDIMAAAKKEAEEACKRIEDKSEQDVKSVLSRAESGAALLEKKLLLDAKQQLIGEIIEKARKRLCDLPDEEYFSVILKLIRKQAQNKPGKLVLSDRDMNRLPKDFSRRIGQTLKDIEGASLEVSDQTVKIDGGFILVYGDVEENCSFDALFSAARDELQDKVNKLLFD